MSEEIHNNEGTQSDAPPEGNRPPDKFDGCAKWAAYICVYGFLLAAFVTCGRAACGSDHDDTWGHLDRSVKSDPYYKQWD